jgi:hypothetical protein
MRQAFDAAALVLFPSRVTLDVTPGNARIKAGSALSIQARLVGNLAPVAAQLQIAAGDNWRAAEMSADKPGEFRLALDSIVTSFKYRVVAGAVTSSIYDITVVKPPRVARIDVDYAYPEGLNLKARTERDSGDIYAPAGTDVRVHVITDQPAASGRMALGNGKTVDLEVAGTNELAASLKVNADDSYRLALADHEGLSSDGDVEYFIRILEDRPPDVRVLKPASDRSVTRLEEVEIDAQAEDDYGIDRLDLVYSIRGDAEKTISLKIPRGETTVAGHHTLFLEDMDVQPGDFVSYYLRARDLTRGTRPNEARSDIFFLEIKPYEQEFSLAQSQASAAGGAGGRGSIDELVVAQKEIIVATWKLDRRAQATKGAKSEQDVRSVARAEAELRTRVESASSGLPRNGDARSATPAGRSADAAACAAAAVARAASRRPDDGGRGCVTAAAEAMGPGGRRTGRTENRRRTCAGDGSAQLPAEGARRSQKT